MALAFTVSFQNTSQFPLRHVSDGINGDWTPRPPDRIDPGETAEWQTTSDKFATGTSGWVQYSVGLPPDPKLGEVAAGVLLTWENKFIGGIDFAPTLRQATEDLAVADVSNQFEVVVTASGDPGSDAADDFATAVVVGPVSLFHARAPKVYWEFRRRGRESQPLTVGLTVDLPAAPPTVLVAVSRPTGDAWCGAWAEREVGASRIDVNVSAAKGVFDVEASEFSTPRLSLHGVRSESRAVVAYRGDVWPQAPIPATPVKRVDVPSLPNVRNVAPSTRNVVPTAPSRPNRPASTLKGNDVLPLGNNVLLELYEERIAATREHLRNRLRYVATSGGVVHADVMLYPHTSIR
jgi:hypothetical protein